MTIRPLGAVEIAGEYTKSIARSVARMAIKRTRRTPRVVTTEYEDGRWSAVAAARAWEEAPTLQSFLIRGGGRRLVAIIDGRICEIAEEEFLRHRWQRLTDLVERSLGTEHDIVELGSGYGYNLFSLSLKFPECRFLGFDISLTGIETARAIATRFGLSERVQFDVLDLTNANSPQYKRLCGKAVFSFFCLEQIPLHIDAVLANIARARPWRVLNVEPAAELLSPFRPKDWANILYIKSMHYQTTLLAALERMHKAHEVVLISKDRLAFAPTIQQLGLAAIWEPGPVHPSQ